MQWLPWCCVLVCWLAAFSPTARAAAFFTSPSSRSGAVNTAIPCDPEGSPQLAPVVVQPGDRVPVTYFGEDIGSYEFVLTASANEDQLESLQKSSPAALYYRIQTFATTPGNAFHAFHVHVPGDIEPGDYVLQLRSHQFRSCIDFTVPLPGTREPALLIVLLAAGCTASVAAVCAIALLYRKRGGCVLSDGTAFVIAVDEGTAEPDSGTPFSSAALDPRSVSGESKRGRSATARLIQCANPSGPGPERARLLGPAAAESDGRYTDAEVDRRVTVSVSIGPRHNREGSEPVQQRTL